MGGQRGDCTWLEDGGSAAARCEAVGRRLLDQRAAGAWFESNGCAAGERRVLDVISARRNLSSTAAWHDDRQEEEEEDRDAFLCGLQAATVLMRWPHSGIPVSVSAEIAVDGLRRCLFLFQLKS
jgi:hypothetical protein